MAGKWIATDDAWIRKLVFNDEGAVFVEAAIDYEMDNVLDRDDFNPPEELLGEFEATSSYKASETNQAPSLIVQVTRFKCGGVALALNYHHMTVDGFGFNRFLKAWSEILSTGQTTAKPVFDRSSLPSHLDKKHILGISPHMANPDDVLSGHFRFYKSKVRYYHVSRCFCSIRKDGVEKLRQKAKEYVSDIVERPERFTTFECVCAQLWRCFARIPKDAKDMISMVFPVEGRTRWSNPPLPEDYIGNLIMTTVLPTLRGPEVTDKPFSFAASHVRESVVKTNQETSGEYLGEYLNAMKMIKERKSTEKTLETENPVNRKRIFQVVLSSWARFDTLYNLDFGYGGPYLLSPCVSGGPDLMVCLLAPHPKSGNAVDLFICTSPENINILLEDPEFVYLVSSSTGTQCTIK